MKNGKKRLKMKPFGVRLKGLEEGRRPFKGI